MFTGSGRARAILDNWDTTLGKFIKVMPVDYKRALREMAEETQTTEPPAEVATSTDRI
mgnify:CR=1 FL=1